MTLQKKCGPERIVLAGLLAGLVIAAVSYAFQFLIQALLPYNVLELGGMRSVGDPLMLLFFLHPWVVGFTMVLVYPFFIGQVQCGVCRPLTFGALVWIVSAFPQFFIVFSSMDYPLGFYVNQLFGSFLYMVAAAYVIWRILD